MIVCWDASAVVKLLRREEGSDLARRLWRSDAAAVASTLVHAEVAAALARGRREGGLTRPAHEQAVVRCRKLLAELDLFAVTERRATRAAQVVDTFGLRGADGVHLATALEVADTGADVVLATWDRRLSAAAWDAGVSVAPAEW